MIDPYIRHLSIGNYWLEFYRRCYEVSREPMLAWLAYKEAREIDCDVPEWVTDYFRDSTEALLTIYIDQGNGDRKAGRNGRQGGLSRRLAGALGFKIEGRSGARNPFTSINSIEDKIWVAWLVEHFLREIGKEKEAKRSTVEFLRGLGNSISERTVDRYWRKWRKVADLSRPRGRARPKDRP